MGAWNWLSGPVGGRLKGSWNGLANSDKSMDIPSVGDVNAVCVVVAVVVESSQLKSSSKSKPTDEIEPCGAGTGQPSPKPTTKLSQKSARKAFSDTGCTMSSVAKFDESGGVVIYAGAGTDASRDVREDSRTNRSTSRSEREGVFECPGLRLLRSREAAGGLPILIEGL